MTRGRVPIGRSSNAEKYHSNVSFAIYRVGPGAVDPEGIGEALHLRCLVLGGFPRVDDFHQCRMYAMALRIAFGYPYDSRPNGVHQSLVAKVETHRFPSR